MESEQFLPNCVRTLTISSSQDNSIVKLNYPNLAVAFLCMHSYCWCMIACICDQEGKSSKVIQPECNPALAFSKLGQSECIVSVQGTAVATSCGILKLNTANFFWCMLKRKYSHRKLLILQVWPLFINACGLALMKLAFSEITCWNGKFLCTSISFTWVAMSLKTTIPNNSKPGSGKLRLSNEGQPHVSTWPCVLRNIIRRCWGCIILRRMSALATRTS